MANSNKKVITKSDWVSSFMLIGVPKINDFTFKIDERSEKSNWIYNNLNLGIDCGEKYGTVYSELMGGYSENGKNVIYAHGKKDDGSDDFSIKIEVDWEDRFDERILDQIGDMCFISVGLEKTDNGKTFVKKFLSAYDAIAYINDHLREDMVVNVKGNLKYSLYNDKVQVKKNISSIILSKADDVSKYVARFTQSILIDKDSASLKNIDKDKSVMYVDAKVLDYMKEYNGIEVRGQYPYPKQFEFEMNLSNEAQCKKIVEKVFKVKKDVTQITFEGNFIEGGAQVQATWDDVPDDIKDLVECGVYTKEDALARCSSNGSKEQRMVLKKPYIKQGREDSIPVLQKFEGRYTEEDLVLDYLYENSGSVNGFETIEDDDVPFGNDASDMSWLDKLD